MNKKRIFIVILLIILTILFMPLGLLGLIFVIWKWTAWAKWVKILLTLIFTSPIWLLLIYLFLFRPFQIKGTAMYPEYKDGQYYLASLTHNITRGDVIVFRAPPDPERDYFKRVIGLPGDKIMLKNGNVYLNDKILSETYSNGTKTYESNFLKNEVEITVPSNNYFVLGDNRVYSSDSRDWGFVPSQNIIGKFIFCYFKCK